MNIYVYRDVCVRTVDGPSSCLHLRKIQLYQSSMPFIFASEVTSNDSGRDSVGVLQQNMKRNSVVEGIHDFTKNCLLT